jgi:hypothetical protein
MDSFKAWLDDDNKTCRLDVVYDDDYADWKELDFNSKRFREMGFQSSSHIVTHEAIVDETKLPDAFRKALDDESVCFFVHADSNTNDDRGGSAVGRWLQNKIGTDRLFGNYDVISSDGFWFCFRHALLCGFFA